MLLLLLVYIVGAVAGRFQFVAMGEIGQRTLASTPSTSASPTTPG